MNTNPAPSITTNNPPHSSWRLENVPFRPHELRATAARIIDVRSGWSAAEKNERRRRAQRKQAQLFHVLVRSEAA